MVYEDFTTLSRTIAIRKSIKTSWAECYYPEQADGEVEKTTDWVVGKREIRQLIHTLMASRDIPKDSRI
jgi:hypothetical protein